jgi:adenosylcobinamide-phosphate synthase
VLSLPHSLPILLLAAALDYLLADPVNLLHPVQVMGWLISRFSQYIISSYTQGLQRQLAGIILGLGLIFGSAIVGWLLVKLVTEVNLILGKVLEIILLASCFAGRSLRLAALDVLQPLKAGKIELARAKLSQYVGRDTKQLTEAEILRAVLETISENTTDGVTSPLFYAILGAFFPEIGTIPLALAYKAASTLDSMIGYQKEPYIDVGKFSALLEDRLTWLPCRLTVLTLAFLSGNPQKVWRLCQRDAPQDPSPNSGWSECAYAAALDVQIGGENYYDGVLKFKPLLGDPLQLITPEIIFQALQLMRWCFLIWLGIAVVWLMVNG